MLLALVLSTTPSSMYSTMSIVLAAMTQPTHDAMLKLSVASEVSTDMLAVTPLSY